MPSTESAIEKMTLSLSEEIRVQAPIEVTFETLLEQLGPSNETPEGQSLKMKLEAWPGGRWYRDLGDNNGHFWGQVQAIKRPTLLEISGPLFLSYAAVSNLQYRLSEVDGGTLIKFHHKALGLIEEKDREGVAKGWGYMHASIRKRAAAAARRGKTAAR
jgi:Activator of Hsp90 ATPase homolog 1-like protein